MNNNRIVYVDIAKCLAIFLVLWGHVLCYLASPESFHKPMTETLYAVIYIFHMPLFMFLSGLFASKSIRKPLPIMVCLKAKQLLWPCITFGFILSFFYYKWGGEYLVPLKHGPLWFGIFYDYWFLHTLFFNFCVAWIIYRLPRKFRLLTLLVLMVVTCFLYSREHNMINIPTMLPFFFTGIEAKEHNILEFIKEHKNKIFIGSSILFVFFAFIYRPEFNSTMYFFHPFSPMKLLEFLFRLFMGGLGTISAITLCYIIEQRYCNHKFISLLSRIGGNTLYIYVLQGVLVECVLAYFIKIAINDYIFALILSPILSTVLLAVLHCVAIFTRRVRWLDIVLFGNFKLNNAQKRK